ncbi:MAG: hypothetical protein JWP35_759 [Caulobacter sp.]|nr:hypothetical protein [Caulobacter sp.]
MSLSAEGVNIATHVAAGAAGLVVGLIPLLTPKGGRWHRRAGKAFVALAGVGVATAVIADIFFASPMALVAVTLSIAYQLVAGLRSLALRGRGPGLLDAGLAAAALAGCAALALHMGEGTRSFTPMIGYSTLGYVATIALYDLSRHAWAGVWLSHVRPLDHGLKMVGVYFGMMSAGAGNLLRGFQPISQVAPSAIGMLVMVVIAVMWFTKTPLIPTKVGIHRASEDGT